MRTCCCGLACTTGDFTSLSFRDEAKQRNQRFIVLGSFTAHIPIAGGPPGGYDIIIDDDGHDPSVQVLCCRVGVLCCQLNECRLALQMAGFRNLFPLVKPGGLYVIEDTEVRCCVVGMVIDISCILALQFSFAKSTGFGIRVKEDNTHTINMFRNVPILLCFCLK